MSFILFVGGLIGGDVPRLDAERWPDREAAHARLKRCGPFAVPAMLDGMRHESPEVRSRCAVLLAPWRRVWSNLWAAHVLAAPEPPDPLALYHDHRLRQHVFHLAERLGCVCCCDPDLFWGGGWPSQWELPPDALELLVECFRAQIRATKPSRAHP